MGFIKLLFSQQVILEYIYKRQASGRLSFFETITGSDPVAFGVINWTLPNFEAKVPDVSPGMTIIIESDTPVIKCQYTYE